MAFIQDRWCNECRRKTQHINDCCSLCAKRERRVQDAVWNALTVDERLNDLRKRIEKLEQGPAIYK